MNNEFELQPLSSLKSEQEPFKSEKNEKENDDEACTSSGSDSDSDSESSDSGSDSGSQSRSRSKSRSPVVSSASSSDSDASSSSNETDVDVDITSTSDDEKDGAQSKCKSLASELLMLSSPVNGSGHGEKCNKKVGNKQEDNIRSPNAEYGNAIIDDDASQAVKNHDRSKTSQYHENGGTVTQMIGLNGHKTASESLQEMNLQSNQHIVSEIDKVVSHGSLANGDHEKNPLRKKTTEKTSKSKNFKTPLEMQSLDEKKGVKNLKGLSTASEGNKRNNTILSEEAPYFSENSERKNKRKETSSNANPITSFSAEKSEGEFRSTKHGESTPYAKLEESDTHIRNIAKVRRVNTVAGVRSSLPELENKWQSGNGQPSQFQSFGMDNLGKESTLQRTFSELEVGEFREPLYDDIEDSKVLIDSSKIFENESIIVKDASLDLVKQKVSGKINSNLEERSSKNHGFQKKITEIPLVESTRPEQPQHLLRPTFPDSGISQSNNRSRYCSEPGNQAAKKNSFGCHPNGNYVSESTKVVQKVVEPKDDLVQKKDAIIQNGQSSSVKKIKSSPEEELLLSKFEKDKPEEKKPISDYNQCVIFFFPNII